MRIAIVTGASSGLGREYVLEINRREHALEEIWVIARRAERLEKLRELSAIPLRCFPMDLTDPQNIAAFQCELEAAHPLVTILINAAGFGKIGDYSAVGISESNKMIDLNCKAAVDLTYLCLPYMERGSRIMQICSTAAFQPFQYLNIYAASKAFLYRFSRALHVELFSRGIKVTAVCPYWIRDTEFIPVAGMAEHGRKSIRHFPLSSKTASVVRISYFTSRLGLPVSTPGIVCTLHWIAGKILPSDLLMGIWAILRRV